MSKDFIKMRIRAADCPGCGHHEIGAQLVDGGVFLPLRSGMEIYLLKERAPSKPGPAPTQNTRISNA